MDIKQVILPTMCCLPLLCGCSTYPSTNTAAWVVQPMTSVRNSTDKPEAYYQLGRYYQGQNRYDQAILAYRKALAVDNNFVEARNGLGVIYSVQGKYVEAIDALKLAVQQAPRAAHIYNNLGYAYYLQGQNAEAIATLREAARLDPHNQRALNNLGLAYAKAGNYPEAIVALTQSIKKSDVTLNNVAQIDSTQPLAVAPALAQNSPVVTAALQSQVLPQDKGVPHQVVVPQIESQVKAVQVSPNVYELHERVALSAPVAEVSNVDPVKLEIANGNGVTGMAKKVKQYLRGQGYATERVTNQKPFNVQITQIQYRNGHQLEAKRLQLKLAKQSNLVQNDGMYANVNVRIVLGKNIAKNVAFSNGSQESTRIALNEE
jgi:tetratricopeptide (TPR) repeat protein